MGTMLLSQNIMVKVRDREKTKGGRVRDKTYGEEVKSVSVKNMSSLTHTLAQIEKNV